MAVLPAVPDTNVITEAVVLFRDALLARSPSNDVNSEQRVRMDKYAIFKKCKISDSFLSLRIFAKIFRCVRTAYVAPCQFVLILAKSL